LRKSLDGEIDLIVQPVFDKLAAHHMSSTDPSIFLVVHVVFVADLDRVVLLVQEDDALLGLDKGISGHDGIVDGAGDGHFIFIAKFIVELEEGGKGNWIVGDNDGLHFQMLFSEGQQLALHEVDADLNRLEMRGRLPFAYGYRIVAMVLEDDRRLGLHSQGNYRHEQLIAIELDAWHKGISLELERNM
jgi:hypothetical protein